MSQKRIPHRYESFDDAIENGDYDVWPGCGSIGVCMPCGMIRNVGVFTGAVMLPAYLCAEYHDGGCPDPQPEPEHGERDIHHACKLCGHVDAYTFLQNLRPAAKRILLELAEKGKRPKDTLNSRGVVRTKHVNRLVQLNLATHLDDGSSKITPAGIEAARLLREGPPQD